MKTLVVLGLVLGAATATIYFEDRFEKDDWESRWVYSAHKGAEAGKFAWTAGKFYGDADADKGLQTSQDARFYGLSAAFDKPMSNKDRPLVVQFTVKHEQNIDCGGGYVKLFDCGLDQADMHGDSEYKIMFGPDICGSSTRKTHVIFNYKGENHLIKKEPSCKTDEMTHLYTLVVNPDGTYEVLIDNESEQKGTLEADWSMLPARKIKDPAESKPADWDDREQIDDPEDAKPDDWDQPEHVADADATKPDDWDDEMDGEWEPPMVSNPDYKGEWSPKKIDNPDYKGKWVHPEIDNPDFDEAEVGKLGKYDELCKIGLDLWQVKSGTIFDNFVVTDDPAEARRVADETWAVTKDAEKAMKDRLDEEKRKADEEAAKEAGKDGEDDYDAEEFDDDDDEAAEEEDAPAHEEL